MCTRSSSSDRHSERSSTGPSRASSSAVAAITGTSSSVRK
uniref:KCS5 n=1 Tax=Arundo donax TaxID=35708 RepID=A0A0A9EXI3_ARUDO